MGIKDSFAKYIHRDYTNKPKEIADLQYKLEALLDSKINQIEQLFTEDELVALENIGLECLLGWYMNQKQVLGYGNSSNFNPDLTLVEPMLQELQTKMDTVNKELTVLRNQLAENQSENGEK